MRGLPQKQNARRADKIRLCGHLRRYKKIVKKIYIIYNETFIYLYDSLGDTPKEYFYKYLTKSLQSMLDCLYNNVSDLEMLKVYKTSIFVLFYQSINIKEYYSYSFSITI